MEASRMRIIELTGFDGVIATLTLMPDGILTYEGPECRDPRQEGCWNPLLPSRPGDWGYPEQGRVVWPSEGDLFLTTLVQNGGNDRSRWVELDDDTPDEEEPATD